MRDDNGMESSVHCWHAHSWESLHQPDCSPDRSAFWSSAPAGFLPVPVCGHLAAYVSRLFEEERDRLAHWKADRKTRWCHPAGKSDLDDISDGNGESSGMPDSADLVFPETGHDRCWNGDRGVFHPFDLHLLDQKKNVNQQRLHRPALHGQGDATRQETVMPVRSFPAVYGRGGLLIAGIKGPKNGF